jgi:polyferredoxin
MTTSKFHYVKQYRQDRTGRARRGTDTTAKKYHLTYCGREVTDRELDSQQGVAGDCTTCARAIDAVYN